MDKRFYCVLIDDDEDDQIIFSQIMQSYFPEVSFRGFLYAHEGFSFLSENVMSQGINCMLFLDLNMPKESGLRLLEKLRSTVGLESLKIIIYSTSNNPQDINACLKKGADAFVTKPSKVDGIVQALHDLFLKYDFVPFKKS